MKKVPASGGLQDLTVVELKEMAKTKGVSLNMTKQDVIELLDELEPGIDHSGLQGQALIAAKKKHHIGPLKNKQQLIEALQKTAGEEMAEKAKQEAVEAAKNEALKKAKDELLQASAKIGEILYKQAQEESAKQKSQAEATPEGNSQAAPEKDGPIDVEAQ